MDKKEITSEIRKCFGMNKNDGIIYQNLWDEAKPILRGKY